MGRAKLSRAQREGNTSDQLLDYLEELEHPGWQAEVAFDLSQVLFNNAYENGADDTDAVEFTESVSKPLVQHAHGEADEPVIDTAYWRNRIDPVPGENYGFHVSPSPSQFRDTHRFYELRESLQETVEDDAFDYAIGVFSGGMAPVYAATDYLDVEDEIILRYSPYRGNDDEVQITAEMQERGDFADASVLIVDDLVETGGTLDAVGDYLDAAGAAEVYAVPVMVKPNKWDVSSGGELLQRTDDGSYRPAEQYEDKHFL